MSVRENEGRGTRGRRSRGDEHPTGGRGRAGRLGGVLVLSAVVGIAACGRPSGGEDGGVPEAAAAPAGRENGGAGDGPGPDHRRVINVETEILETGPFTEVIRLTGTAAAHRRVEVAAEEAGVIRELPVEKGSRVRAGQVIARIDDVILAAQVEEARARARLARETWERRRKLFERDGAISELDYLDAKYRAEEAAARLASLEERLRRTRVRAPIDGVLDERPVEVGSTVAPGTTVARIVDADPVEISAGVPERYAPDVAVGTTARASFDVLPDTGYTGRLTYVGASVDRDSRTFPVEMVVANPGGRVKPQMVANVEIVRRRWTDALVVPQGALVRTEEGFTAFVVEAAGGAPVARERPVELGPTRENRVVVTSGLAPGDRLVVVGQTQVAEGDRVRVVGPARDGGGR